MTRPICDVQVWRRRVRVVVIQLDPEPRIIENMLVKQTKKK